MCIWRFGIKQQVSSLARGAICVMEPAPPLRFGAQPLAGKKSKSSGSLRTIRKVIPNVAKRKGLGSAHPKPLALPGFKYRPCPFTRRSAQLPKRKSAHRLNAKPATQKTTQLRRSSQRLVPAGKSPTVRQSSQATKRARRWQERGDSLSHGTASMPGKRSQLQTRNFMGVLRTPGAHPSSPDIQARRKIFDGSVSESQHLEYHAGFKGFCIRCDVQKRRKVYDAWSFQNGSSWLSRGVNCGVWGLGCRLCAEHLASGENADGARFSKFAKFLVRPTSGWRAKMLIEQHLQWESHRVACRNKRKRFDIRAVPPQPQALPCPITCPNDRLVVASAEDAMLLKGSVPSPAEWKDAWAQLTEPLSFRKAARIFEKQLGTSDCVSNRKRKIYRKQVCVMAEVLRNKIRKVLSQATCISLALDECKYRKIIRFRADLPIENSEPDRHIGASGFSYSGVLGLLDCSKKHASDFEEDHAVIAVKQLDVFFTEFCTPLGRVQGQRGAQPLECDQDLKAHVMKSVTCISADGAAKERRAVFLAARSLFPNLLIVIRDPAHALRIASKALHCDDVFGQVWRDLFDSRHALVPDLMNSSKWHNLLVSIQEDNIQAVTSPGVPRPLAGVLRNVAFAKQRFDSTVGPVGKIALMILPVATLLAYVASDRRNESDQRQRATLLLKQLDTKFCTAIGVSADWGIICNFFLRLFDEASHDIAKSRSQIDCMIETLDAVFVEGDVFKRLIHRDVGVSRRTPAAVAEPLPRIHTSVSDEGTEVGFITSKVLHNLRNKMVFYAGGLPVLLWGEPTSAHKEELLHRLQNVACLTKERLLADFPRHDVRSALAMFDRRLVLKGFGPLPDPAVRKFLLQGACRMAGLLGLEEAAVVLQYNSVIAYMLEQMRPFQPLAEQTNQQAWARLLDDAFWEAACPKRLRFSSRALCCLIRFYISIEDGECTVERDLGEFRAQVQEHRTNSLTFLSDVLCLRLNGPRTAEEFNGGVVDSRIYLTPFSKHCSCLWLTIFGNRLGHYNAQATAAAKLKRQKMTGTFRGATLEVLAAARLSVLLKRRKAAQVGSSGNVVHPGAGTADSALWNASMSRFQKRSRNNIPGVTQVRARAGSSFIKPVGIRMTALQAAAPQPLAGILPCAGRVAIVGAGWGSLPLRESRIQTGLHRCAKADLVIVPDLSLLHDVTALAAGVDLAVSFLYIVSLGVDITTHKQLVAVQGVPRHISYQHRMRHVAANKQKVTFCVGPRLRIEHEAVEKALRRIAALPASKFIVSRNSTSASGEILLSDLRDVVAWACSARRIQNEVGPKAVLADGRVMPS